MVCSGRGRAFSISLGISVAALAEWKAFEICVAGSLTGHSGHRSVLCEEELGRRRWGRMANDLAFDEIDYQLGDVGGMIPHPFEIFSDETQPYGS